jgi:mono/diheme cytochrome c family protein
MNSKLRALGFLLTMAAGGWAVAQIAAQDKPQEKAKETAAVEKTKEVPNTSAAAPAKANPVKATPEALAEAKKIFGYDCAMCHGEAGDGKGELVESMKLTMKNWHESTAVDEMSDEAIYNLIIKGRDKMVGEGDRLAPAKIWGLVHYVRTISKKKSA